MNIARTVAVLSALSLVVPFAASVEGCASKKSAKKKGGGAKGAAAKTEKQKAGSTATSKAGAGTSKGAEVDGVTCDGAAEGTSWCESDTSVLLCVGGDWKSIDCAALSSVCAEDESTNAVDCVATSETEE